MSKKQIFYSDKYNDDEFEYRHVVLPKQLSKLVPSSHLMTEEEWRGLGVQQSQGWIHYMIHKPAPNRGSCCNFIKHLCDDRKSILILMGGSLANVYTQRRPETGITQLETTTHTPFQKASS